MVKLSKKNARHLMHALDANGNAEKYLQEYRSTDCLKALESANTHRRIRDRELETLFGMNFDQLHNLGFNKE